MKNKELTRAFGKRYQEFCATRGLIKGTQRNIEVITQRNNEKMDEYIKNASNKSTVHSEDGYDPLQSIIESYSSGGWSSGDT